MTIKSNSDEEVTIKINPSFFKKIRIEAIAVVVFFIILFNFLTVFDGGYLVHENGPYNFAAGDMFTFVAFADLAKYQEDLTKQPAYMAAGNQDAVNFFSITGGLIEAQLSNFIGAESYDFIIHLNLLFMILSTLIIFYFVSKIDLRLAVFGLPLSLLLFKWPFQYAITWGMHGSSINLLFVAASLLCLYYLDQKYVFILLGILNGAGVLAHAREFLMFNLGVALYFLIRLIKEKTFISLFRNPLSIKNLLKENKTIISLRNYIFSIPITLLMMFRILPVFGQFMYGSNTMGPSSIIKYDPPNQFHHVFFNQFGFYQYLIVIGIVIAAYLIFTEKSRKMDIILSFSLMFLLNGFFRILNNKTSQIRHLFPILLMPLVGLVLYFACAQLKKLTKINKGIIFSVFFLLITIPTAIKFMPDPVSDYAFSNPYNYEGMVWLRNNQKETETTLMLYGDGYTQPNMFTLTRKVHYLVIPEKYIEKINKKILSSKVIQRGDIVHFYARQPKFNELQIITPTVVEKEASICDYDYVYSDKFSQNKKIQDYTQKLLSKLINDNKFVIVFQNDLMVILKNKEVGEKCFDDEVI